jgi:hypothetical protein
MGHFGGLKNQRGLWLCCGAMCALMGFAVGTFSQSGKQLVVTPIQSAKFLPTLRPGSYWFQPGNQAHGDECLSDECLIFVSWQGKMDVQSCPICKPLKTASLTGL